MHDPTATGADFFVCDFCRKAWAEDRPMVEGHQGSLVCSKCLSLAYMDVVHLGGGHEQAGLKCTMCLEERKDAQWSSPAFGESRICRRCIKQSATVLEKDEEAGWKRPVGGGGVGEAGG
jgi:hypothetical protein